MALGRDALNRALSSAPPVRLPAVGQNRRQVSVLGATGSVGQSTLNLIENHAEQFEVVVLTAHRNVAELAALAIKHNATVAVIADPALYSDLAEALSGTGIEATAGPEALVEAASAPVDWSMAGIVGAAGLLPTLAAVQAGTDVALANKECLVCAGDLVKAAAKASGARLLPADSEHNAIFQVFDFDHPHRVEKITLTASGGPFWQVEPELMANARPADALAHPNWDMGAKISIDSATMMNKGLEYIEACHLFPVNPDQVDVMIHPQSVIHSMVSYRDGSVLAQLGAADMRIPIAHTLAWPDRLDSDLPRLNLAEIGRLEFAEPDHTRFPALKLAEQAYRSGGSYPVALNASNEAAVAAFLAGRIGFLDIVSVVASVLDVVKPLEMDEMAKIWDVDRQSRTLAEARISAISDKA